MCEVGRIHLQEQGEEIAVQTVKELADAAGALGAADPEDGAAPIDVELLREQLTTDWNDAPSRATLVDGHLSHLLAVDAIVIIRCEPSLLAARNEARGWPEQKVTENSEWELLGGPWNDWEEWADTPVLELDSSEVSPETSFSALLEWAGNGFKPERPEQSIDWIERLHG
jgi:adenylate kinase